MHFFDPDSPLMNGLSRMTDLVLLNLITLAACLPVFTAGASLTAMHFVLLKMVRGEEGYIVRDWVKSFKQNFRQATLIWLLFLAAGLMALLDIWMAAYGKGGAALVLRVLLILVILIAYADFLWAFPRTLAMGAAGVLPLIIWIFFPSMAPLVLLFGASIPGIVSAYMYSPLFKRLEMERRGGEDGPERDPGEEEDPAL